MTYTDLGAVQRAVNVVFVGEDIAVVQRAITETGKSLDTALRKRGCLETPSPALLADLHRAHTQIAHAAVYPLALNRDPFDAVAPPDIDPMTVALCGVAPGKKTQRTLKEKVDEAADMAGEA